MASKQFKNGVIAGLPVLLGYIPVGIAYAILAHQAGFGIWETCSLSVFVFAGASQMMAAGMYAQGAGLAAIIIATFILNLRHIIMSACILNRMGEAPLWKRLAAMFGTTDESFAVFTTEKRENCTLPFFAGVVVTTYLAWNAGTLLGAVLSDFLPEIITASLGIALYALFISLLVPKISGNLRLTALAVLTGLCNLLLCLVMESSWALIVSTLLCAFIGVFFVRDEDLGEEAQTNEA
ncbi:MAG: AzlC family ABC transporter permease [Oscillospiraceae bacterium]|nr:AzlC family ABC transporter permease [Oscillospiraceae bacterium]